MKSSIIRTTAVFLAINMLAQCVAPAAYALSGGPSQPEVQSFEPVGTTEMVDLFSGDFVYNIPLLDVEGYPVNISYHSGITMDQEASWTGLGWNINPGVINRNMRGLPDDFKNDEVKKDMFIKSNYTYGLSVGGGVELFAINMKNILKKFGGNLSFSLGVFYNSYRGVGFEQTITPSISAGNKLKLNSALAISSSTQNGMSISPSTGISLDKNIQGKNSAYTGTASFSVGASYNSRSGVKSLTFSKGLSFKKSSQRTESVDEKTGEKTVTWKARQGGSLGANNGGSSVSYANESYTPQISMPMSSANVTFDAKIGTSFWGSDGTFDLKGYFSNQYLKEDRRKIAKGSYGYLYASDARDLTDVLLDINREKDGSFSKANPNLPVTMFSHDLYAVSGQGIGGMFRPYRGDVGHVHDDAMESGGGGGSLGVELGVGTITKWGVSATGNHSASESHKWYNHQGNNLGTKFRFKAAREGNDPTYEPVYFKSAGEKTQVEKDFLPYQNMNQPVRPAFHTFNNITGQTLSENIRGDILIAADGNEMASQQAQVKSMAITNTYKAKREARNQAISYITAAEGSLCNEPGSMKSYRRSSKYPFTSTYYDPISRTDGQRKGHHITEISATNPGGSRYIYGIAAYNNSQEEVTFTIKGQTGQSLTDARMYGITDYRRNGPGVSDGYYENKKGETSGAHDGYYNGTKLPGFAHSYLLTAVLSPDYMDKTDNGPTEDDLGNYTKINYTRTSHEYKWRTPYHEGKAMYHEAMRSDDSDDKGTIVYGEKEVWHVHSIETKNYIAEFNLFRREDGVGVKGIHGGREVSGDERYSYGLESIKLYTKAEKKAKGVNAVPVKVVHFEYTYELCPNIINNSGAVVAGASTSPYQNAVANINSGKGKLTLKRIYFSYGKSNKGKLSSYEFNYGSNNPEYDVKAYDRWGNYKPNKEYNAPDTYLAAANSEFPYTQQGKDGNDDYYADLNAKAWSLEEIKLPSGGKIKVSYEADDYAYVQDKNAMQMFGIAGFSQSGTSATPRLFGANSDQRYGYNWVHVHLPEVCEGVNQFQKYYIPDPYKPWDATRYLFFTFLTCVKGNESRKEYVRGYAEIDYHSDPNQYIKQISTTEYAIKVKDVRSEDTDFSSYTIKASPFAKAAWQYFRLSLPQYVYPGSNVKKDDGGGETAIRSLLGIFFDAFEYMQGVNDLMLKKGFASHVETSRCWVRLKNGTGYKKGGGVRVKKLELEDGWDAITGNETKSVYGQEYDYTVMEGGRSISSGVASYEPMIGNEENPFRLPVMTTKENSLIPDESFYIEEPLGESFFPSASVGYSKVTVRNLQHPGVTKHATGKVVNEFYTTRDFPTMVSRTNTQTHKKKPNWITGLATFKVKDHVTAVQGYQVELNDMNGKPEAEWVYAENLASSSEEGRPISGKHYFYKTDLNNPGHLNNNVVVATPNRLLNESATVLVGVDAEMILDTREQLSSSGSYGVDLNADLILAGFFPIPVPVPIPSFSSDESRFRSAVITRIIQRYGLLAKTVAYADGAAISTENMVYDAQTGEVLLTRTQNEYKDDVYNLTYPAHWVHDGMGQAYQNSDLVLNVTLKASTTSTPPGDGGWAEIHPTSNGTLPSGSYTSTYIKEGDEVKIDGVRYWYTNDGYFMDRNGNTLNATSTSARNLDVRVLRPVRRNMQTTPVLNLTSRFSPITPSSTSGVNQLKAEAITGAKGVINASAFHYAQEWKNYCLTQSEMVGNRADYDAREMVDVINYLIKTGTIMNFGHDQVTPIPAVPSTEYDKYLLSFVKETFDYCDSPEQVTYTYYFDSINTSRGWQLFFPTCNTYTGTAMGYLPISVFVPIDSCNTLTAVPTRIEYVSDLTDYTSTQANGETYIRMYFSSGCSRMGTISIRGDVFRYGAMGSECVSKAPVTPNRFAINEKGTWRKKKDMLFLVNRIPADNTATDIRKDGAFEVFELNEASLLKRGNETIFGTGIEDIRWQWTTETTQIIPEGFDVETRDALDRYNSVLYEEDLLPVAVANNAKRRDIGSDGFEYYPKINFSSGCYERHWHFKKSPTPYEIDSTVSHTGICSMKLTAGQEASNSYFTRAGCSDTNYFDFMNSRCDECLLPFTPYPKKAYVLSGWVKTTPASSAGNVANRDVSVEVTFNDQARPQTIVIKPSGTIIEGWQRFEQKIMIPEDAFTINVTLNAASSATTWYDDVRIYPFDGNMKSFVYDPSTKRLMAELDENNYATFYEYDEQGALKRVKKETERGIMTLKESRNHTSKQ